MQFGEKIISLKHCFMDEYMLIEKTWLNITKVSVGDFIMKRPDNRKIIIEIEDSLFTVLPNEVVPLTQENIEDVIRKLLLGFQQEEIKLEEEKKELNENKSKIEEAILNLETQLQNMDKKVDGSAYNRIKSRMELTKALRRKGNKLKTLEMKTNELKEKNIIFNKRKEHSLELAKTKLYSMLGEN